MHANGIIIIKSTLFIIFLLLKKNYDAKCFEAH